MTIRIFIPCFMDQLYPETAFNMVEVLERVGCEVVYNPGQTCCGQPAFNAGYHKDACKVACKLIDDLKGEEPIIVPSASCTGFIRNYFKGLLSDNIDNELIEKFTSRIKEFSEFLTEELKITNLDAYFEAKATYHDSCAGLRECKIKEGPRKLLGEVRGLELVEMKDNETCCGFGGTFAVKFEPISVAMAEQKVQNALKTGAEYIISTDMSCLMQLDGYIRQHNLPIKTLHLADVLNRKQVGGVPTIIEK
jgi:L-lactate dehydrogenase complex protein LldE